MRDLATRPDSGTAAPVAAAVSGLGGQRAQLGEACSVNGDCRSSNCVDGVCCDTSCGGGALDCQACSIAAGAPTNGACAPVPAGFVCRPVAGACDLVDVCDGTSLACPADAVLTSGAPCRMSTGACDVTEVCDGQHGFCPGDAVLPSGSPCRLPAGPCDAPELCDGLARTCPVDAKRPAGALCRPASRICDAADTCDGSSVECLDDYSPDGTPCDDSLHCSLASACQSGFCQPSATIDCSDNNPCTTDLCIEPTGCSHSLVPSCVP